MKIKDTNFNFFEYARGLPLQLKIFDYVEPEILQDLFLMKYGDRLSLYDSYDSGVYHAIFYSHITKWNKYIESYNDILDSLLNTGSTSEKVTEYQEKSNSINRQDTTTYEDSDYTPDTKSEDNSNRDYSLKETSKNNLTININRINSLKYNFLYDIIFSDIINLIGLHFIF